MEFFFAKNGWILLKKVGYCWSIQSTFLIDEYISFYQMLNDIGVARICRGGVVLSKIPDFHGQFKKKFWWAEISQSISNIFFQRGSFAAPDPPCLRLWMICYTLWEELLFITFGVSSQSVMFKYIQVSVTDCFWIRIIFYRYFSLVSIFKKF
jgi:hypothetical protein